MKHIRALVWSAMICCCLTAGFDPHAALAQNSLTPAQEQNFFKEIIAWLEQSGWKFGSRPVKSTPVNGACGTANGSSVLVKPTTNLCSTGTATALTGTGPWAWSCAGLNGGASTSCSAALLKSCTDSTGATHASGTTYSLTVSTSTGTAPATPAQCSYGGTQATTTTTDQTYTCTNGIQTAQSGAKVTTVDTGSPVCKAPAACGSTPSGSTVTNTVSTTTGSMAATTTQCAYGGTVPTKTTVTQVSLCTNGTLTAQGAPVTTTVASGSPVCTAAPVAGQCGTAIVTYSPTKPTINLCASGTASAVTEVVWPGPMQCHADGSVTMLSAGTTAGPGRWEWTCAGTGGNATVSCYASAGLPGPGTPLSTDSHTPNYVGKTDYASLPFQNTIWTGGSPGLEPMQLFAQVNPKSVFIAAEGTCTSAPFSNSRRLASIDEADGIVPAQGAQRWQGTWVNSFAANNITVNGIGTMNIPTSVANNATSNYSAIPEFAAWRDFYIQHPQYWDTTNAGGTVPSNWQSWNGQWGFISPLTPLAKADCPPDMASCTWGDDWAYRWAFTAAMSGEYGMGLSDFSDSFPYGASSQHGFNPRIIKAFAAQYGLAISGTTVTDQANWIVANAYNQWNDYLSQGYGHMFSALANRISAATGRQALVIDQCQGSPLWERAKGADMRVLATQINPANYLCINDNHSLYGITANNISGLPTQEVGNIALESAYEPLMRQGGNFEADISQYWSALQTQYPSLTSAEQTEMGYKLLKRVWLWGSWAHIADRSGDIRRALAFTSRSYFDLGTLTAPQLGPLQSLVQGVIPTQPFGPAIYYSQSAMKAAETYFAQTVGTNNNLFSYANEFDSLLAYIDGAGGPVGYYVSDAALDKIKAGSAAAPSAWIILQDTYNRDALQDIPSAELNELKGIAPVLDVYVAKSGGYNLNAGTDAVAQLAALSNQPLIFTTTGGPSPISAACASAGYPTYLIKNTALTGFGFYDQSNRLIVVTSNPSRCPDAVALSGTINLQNVTFAGKLANGPYTLTDLFANQSMTINIVEGKVTIPVDVARWDSLAYAIAPAQ